MGIEFNTSRNSLIQITHLCSESNPTSVDVLRNGLIPLDGQLLQILQDEFSYPGKYDPFWYNVSFCIKFSEKSERILALIPLHA